MNEKIEELTSCIDCIENNASDVAGTEFDDYDDAYSALSRSTVNRRHKSNDDRPRLRRDYCEPDDLVEQDLKDT